MGLEDFYRYRNLSELGVPKPAAPKGGSFSYLDADDLQKRLVAVDAAGIAAVSLVVGGIHCAGCVWLLEKLPTVLPGLFSSDLNFSTAKLSLRYDPLRIKLSSIAQTLDSLGYPPLPEIRQERERAQRLDDRRMLVRIGVAGFCAANTMMIAISLWQGFFTGIETRFGDFFRWMSFVLTIPAVCYSAYPFYRTAIKALRMRSFHIDLPIAIGILGVFFFSTLNTILGREYVYFDSVTALIFLLLIGRYLQSKATARAREESSRGWDFLPAIARVVSDKGITEVPVQFVQQGDTVEVRPSERIPVDGELLEGNSSLDNSILTGESAPASVRAGDKLFAGTLNLESRLRLRCDAAGEHSRIGKIQARIESQGGRAAILSLTDSMSGYFVAATILGSVGTFLYWWWAGSIYQAIDNAVALLIVTCPCALGLATPVALSVAIGRAAKAGILIKGSDSIERLARVAHIYFDKTGTITQGQQKIVRTKFYCTASYPDESSMKSTLRALVGIAPHHPVSRALGEYVGASPVVKRVEESGHLGGRGVWAVFQDQGRWLLGSVAWGREEGIEIGPLQEQLIQEWCADGLTPVILARGRSLQAAFGLLDTPRADAASVLKSFVAAGKEIYLLSGDVPQVAQAVALSLSIEPDHVYSAAFPEDKLRIIKQDPSLSAMVGDGVNDAAAMRGAYVAIGLHGGIESLLDVVDVFIARGDLKAVAHSFRGAAATMQVIRRNLVISVAYNVIAAACAMLGYINPLIAGVTMPISSLTVIGLSIASKTFNED